MEHFTGAGWRRRSHRAGWWRAGAVVLAIAAAAGCDDAPSITRFEPIDDPERLFMALTLDHRAINLSTSAPHDTFRLTATARNGRGEALNGLPEPTFRSNDTTRVWVTPDGLLQARGPAAGVQVIAEVLSDDNIRRADTAYVSVTADPDPPVLATFSITPPTPEERVWAMSPGQGAGLFGAGLFLLAGVDLIQPVLPRVALDGDGDPIAGLQVDYRSLDPEIAQINRQSGVVSGSLAALGNVRFVATTMAYGIAKADTATVTLVLPQVHGPILRAGHDGEPVLSPTEVTIRQNGYGFWRNETSIPIEIEFSDPTNVEEIPQLCGLFGSQGLCGGGHIPAFDGSTGIIFDNVRGRRFPVPGVYEYQIPQTGHTGRVVVVAKESTP